MRRRRIKNAEGKREDDLTCLEIGEGVRLTDIPAGRTPTEWRGIHRYSGRRRTWPSTPPPGKTPCAIPTGGTTRRSRQPICDGSYMSGSGRRRFARVCPPPSPVAPNKPPTTLAAAVCHPPGVFGRPGPGGGAGVILTADRQTGPRNRLQKTNPLNFFQKPLKLRVGGRGGGRAPRKRENRARTRKKCLIRHRRAPPRLI